MLVIALMVRMSNRVVGHCCWIDNLFTTEWLLLALRDRAIAAAGTARTTKCKTKREMQELAAQELPGNTYARAIQELQDNTIIYDNESDEEEENPRFTGYIGR
jgi:hypothetical protein